MRKQIRHIDLIGLKAITLKMVMASLTLVLLATNLSAQRYRFVHNNEECEVQTLVDSPANNHDGPRANVYDCWSVQDPNTIYQNVTTSGYLDFDDIPTDIRWYYWERYESCFYRNDIVDPDCNTTFCCYTTDYDSGTDYYNFGSDDYQRGSFVATANPQSNFFGGPASRRTINWEVKPIVNITNSPAQSVFCGDQKVSLTANTGWANNEYYWFYTTNSNPSEGDWSPLIRSNNTAVIGRNVDIGIEEFGDDANDIYNQNVYFGVAVGNCALCLPSNMHNFNITAPMTFSAPPPQVDAAAPVAPVCVDGEGSFEIQHSANSPTGVTFIYSVSQLVYAESGECDANPNLPDGINERTLANITSTIPGGNVFVNSYVSTDVFCTGFIGNFQFTINSNTVQDRTVLVNSSLSVNHDGGNLNTLTLYPGVYEIRIENSDGSVCYDEFIFEIPDSPYITMGLSVTPENDLSCAGGDDGSATLNVSNGVANYSWEIRDGATLIDAGGPESTTSFSTNNVLSAGVNYSVRLTDQCETENFIDEFTLSDGPNINAQVTSTDPTCLDGTPNGTITGTATVQLPATDYTFTLFSDANVQQGSPVTKQGFSHTFTDLPDNTYYVQIEPDGCDADNSANEALSGPTALTITATSQDISCSNVNNGQIGISFVNRTTGDYNYSYTLTSSDAIGFTTINGSRSNANAFTISNSLPEGNYILNITDDCSGLSVNLNQSNFEVEAPQPIALDNILNQQVLCYDDSVLVDATWNSGVSVLYNQGPFDINITKNSVPIRSFSGLSAFTQSLGYFTVDNNFDYEVEIIDACGTSDVNTFSVTSAAISSLATTITPLQYANGQNLTCNSANDGRLEIRVSGGIPISGGDKNYNLRLLNDANGSVISGAPVDCENSNDRNCFQFNSLDENTTFRVEVTDDNGCVRNFTNPSLSSPAPLNIDPPVFADFTNLQAYNTNWYVQCNGESNVEIHVDISGGSAPYDILLFRSDDLITPLQDKSNTSDLFADFTGLGAGNYELRVLDQFTCTYAVRNFDLLEGSELLATSIAAENTLSHGANVTCYGDSDGGISIDVTGGIGEYTYSLTSSDGATHTPVTKAGQSHTFGNLPAVDGSGDTILYTVDITDEIGCSWSALNISRNFELIPPDTVEFEWTVTSPNDVNYDIFCRGDYATVQVRSEGGAFPHLLSISGDTIINTSITDADLDNEGFVDIQLLAGSYTFSLQDALNCQPSDQPVSLVEPATHVSISAQTPVPPVCIGGIDGEITVDGSGGVQNSTPGEEYTFKIRIAGSGSFDSDSITGTSATFFRPASADGFSSQDYEIMVLDRYGCSDTVLVNMPPNPDPLTLSVDDLTAPSCNGGNDGSLTVTATNYDLISGTSLLFSISGGHYGSAVIDSLHDVSSFGPTVTFNNLEGTDIVGLPYETWVEDANSCTDTAYQYQDNLQLIAPDALELILIRDIRPSCYNGSDGSFMVQATGGVTPYEISFENGSFVTITDPGGYFFVDNLIEGTYNFRLRDANYVPSQPTCELSSDLVIQPGRFISFNTDIDHASCRGSEDAAIDLTSIVENLAPAESFESNRLSLYWVYDNASSDTISTNEGISNVPAGRYTIKARYDVDSTVCLNEDALTILEPDFAFTISEFITYDASCGNSDDGRLLLTIMGGWADSVSYYNLDNTGWQLFNSSSLVINDLIVGDHNIQVAQSGYSCTDTRDFTIDQGYLALEITSLENPTCIGGNDGVVSLTTGEAGIEYAMVGGSFLNNGGVFGGLTAGSYEFVARRISDTSCQSDTINVTLENPVDNSNCDNTLQIGLLSTVSATCVEANDGVAIVQATGGIPPYSIFWNNVSGSDTRTDLLSGEYSVSVEDAVGSVDSIVVNIEVLELISAEAVSSLASCDGSCDATIDLVISGGTGSYAVTWSNGASGQSIDNLCAGTYDYTITDQLNNSCSIVGSVVVEQVEGLTQQLVASGDPTCNGGNDGSIEISVSGGSGSYAYNWNNGATESQLNDLTAGVYEVTITDNIYGCITSGSYEIMDALAITIADTILVSPSCQGDQNGRITLMLENTTSPMVTWGDGSIGLTLDNIGAGTYSFDVLDALGCSLSGSITLNESEGLTVEVSSEASQCFGECEGDIALTVSGGTAPYFIQWDHGPRSTQLTGLCDGQYSYTVTDLNGCNVSGMVQISSPDDLSATIDHFVEPSCFESNDGEIGILVSGGTPTYSYLWSTGDTTNQVTGLVAGSYTVEVIDNNDCPGLFEFDIDQPQELLITSDSIVEISCSRGTNGEIFVYPVGGSSTYQYAWSDGSTAQHRSNLGAGDYDITITDINGCSVERSYTLVAPDNMEVVNVVTTNPSCQSFEDGMISLEAAGGEAPYAYLWNTGSTSNAIDSLSAGFYTVTITDANGCTFIQSFNLEDSPQLEVTGINEDLVLCDGGEGILEPDTEWASYLWNGPNGFTADTRRIVVTEEGEYTLNATDERGCPVLPQTVFVEVGNNIMETDLLIISESVVGRPVVLLDISLPFPENVEWIIPEDDDIIHGLQTESSLELTFMRADTFEIGLRTAVGACVSEVFKSLVIHEPSTIDNGRVSGEDAEVTVEATAFPNPTDDYLAVQVIAPDRSKVDVVLYSSLENRKILHEKLEGGLEYLIQWEFPRLNSGAYFLYIQHRDQVISKTIIIR